MTHIVKSTQPGPIDSLLPREYAIVEFSHFMSPGMRSLNQAWTTQKAVPLDFPIGNLTLLYDATCKMTRRANNSFMLCLKEKGEAVHTSAAIKFHDERDLYANPTTGAKPRITTIRDLFSGLNLEDAKPSGEPLFVPIAVDISLFSESGSDAPPTPQIHSTTPLPPAAPSPSSNSHPSPHLPHSSQRPPANPPLHPPHQPPPHPISRPHPPPRQNIHDALRFFKRDLNDSDHEFFATRRSAEDVGK